VVPKTAKENKPEKPKRQTERIGPSTRTTAASAAPTEKEKGLPSPKETRHEVKTTRTATGAQSTNPIGSGDQMRNTRRRSNAVDGRVAARLMLEKEVFL